MTTRQTGGLLWGYKPPFTSQRLKALAFTVCSSHIDLDKYIFWTLFLYDNLSKFYSNTNQAKLCFQTLDKAIQFTKTHSCTYFLDHYYFLYATETRNNQGGWNEKSIDYLIQTHVFAKYLENDTVLELTTNYLIELIPSFNWN
ncbi:MAG TPA: hypothetical protein H9829_03695 [Candidatus Tetragenococcus pullicola]|nr:hypothetical protein [Candidatus Tetragenococcus pullicola]